MYQLRITIDGITPPIWRTVQVSENYTLYKLHHIIQKIFGWENSHIWCFRAKGEDAPITNPWLWGEGTTRWDKTVKLKTFLKKEGDSILYEYDMGDSWKHTVILETANDEKIKKPLCIAGKRAGPHEDCGGIGGFNELINHLLHPEKDGYLELLEWLGDDYDPEAFDIANINRNLKSLNFFIRVFDEENGLNFGNPKSKNRRPPSIQISENIILNNLNDIQLSGKCSICDRNVGRYIEYGEVPEVLSRAKAFRDTYRSRTSMNIVRKRK
ncbi:MAG: plasmid pRiA4b ORF-3 family protein [Bacteroidetes bacterium]|nr:plasmid pRiA4b ORF-3 family protein [Bacteroidota bacterium]